MRSGNWLFLNVGGGGWIWRRVDATSRAEIERSAVFGSLAECTADAERHGYVVPDGDLPDRE
jgi:hypothetical protein